MSCVLIWILIFSTFGVKLTVSNVRSDIHFVEQESLTSTSEGFLLTTMAMIASAQSTTVKLQRIDDHYKSLSHSNPLLKSFLSMISILDHLMLLPIPAFFIIYLLSIPQFTSFPRMSPRIHTIGVLLPNFVCVRDRERLGGGERGHA